MKRLTKLIRDDKNMFNPWKGNKDKKTVSKVTITKGKKKVDYLPVGKRKQEKRSRVGCMHGQVN